LTLPHRKAALAEHFRIYREQLGCRRHMSAKVILEVSDDRPSRCDRKLLTGDLKDQRPKGVESRQLVHPGARPEARVGIDNPSQGRVGFAQELLRLALGARVSVGG